MSTAYISHTKKDGQPTSMSKILESRIRKLIELQKTIADDNLKKETEDTLKRCIEIREKGYTSEAEIFKIVDRTNRIIKQKAGGGEKI